MTVDESRFIHNLERVKHNRTELYIPVCQAGMDVTKSCETISVIFDGNVFRLSTTRESLGSTPEKAAATLRDKDLCYINLMFVEFRRLAEFIVGCDTTETDLEGFLRSRYQIGTAHAVLKNPEAVISIREHLGELDLGVRFDQRSGLENKSHCTVHELYEYLQEVSE